MNDRVRRAIAPRAIAGATLLALLSPLMSASAAAAAAAHETADFGGDGATDVAVYRPSTGQWFVEGGPFPVWGELGDVPVPGDYHGDGASDVAVYRPSTGQWFVQGGPFPVWGGPGDVPVPGDYDGDDDTDVVVYRPSTGQWFVLGGPVPVWGEPGDVPVPGDYDGDDDTDVAVYRPSTGQWFVLGGPFPVWGQFGDVPVPGDYHGDGSTDVAVYRPSTGQWFVLGGPFPVWGESGDVPVPGDYHGDDSTDVAVYRPSTGQWFVIGGPFPVWGQFGDVPLALPSAIYNQFFLGRRGLVINEIDYDQPGTDTTEFVEIYNSGPSLVDLSGTALVLVNGGVSPPSGILPREPLGCAGTGRLRRGGFGAVTPAGGTLVFTFGAASDNVQNGPDAAALVNLTTTEVIDAVSYEGLITNAAINGFSGPRNLSENGSAPADSGATPGSISRIPNGVDTNSAPFDWQFTTTVTPGAINT